MRGVLSRGVHGCGRPSRQPRCGVPWNEASRAPRPWWLTLGSPLALGLVAARQRVGTLLVPQRKLQPRLSLARHVALPTAWGPVEWRGCRHSWFPRGHVDLRAQALANTIPGQCTHVMRIPPTQHTRAPATSAPRTCIVVPHHVNLRPSGIACAHMPCQQRRVRVMRGGTVEHTHGDQQRAPEAVGTVAGCVGEHLRVGSLSPRCGGGAQTSMALVWLARSCPRWHEAGSEGSARNSHVRVAAGHGGGRGEVPWGHGNTATNGWAHHLPSHDVRAVCVAGQRRSQHIANWWCWHALCASGPVQTVHVGWCSG